MGEVSYGFSKSSKFQGHIGWKFDDMDLITVRLYRFAFFDIAGIFQYICHSDTFWNNTTEHETILCIFYRIYCT